MPDGSAGRGGADAILDQLLAAARDELMTLTRSCELGAEAPVRAAAVHVRWILHTIERWVVTTAVWDPERYATVAAAVAGLRETAEPLLARAVALVHGQTAARQVAAGAHVSSILHLRGPDGVIDATGTWIEQLTIDADLSAARLAGATLHDVIADHVTADRADARRTLLIRARFVAASLRECILDECAVDSCGFSRANLERTSWRGATVFGSRFDGAVLVDSSLDDALFEDSSFRGADFATIHLGQRATCKGVKFVRCDLRETNWDRRRLTSATFVECSFHGVHGRPQIDDIFVHRPDLSREGDGSLIGTKRQLVDLWRGVSRA